MTVHSALTEGATGLPTPPLSVPGTPRLKAKDLAQEEAHRDDSTRLHDRLRRWTPNQIALRIARGEVLVVHRALVYRLNNWLSDHPGGQLAILHYVGRDATDELEAYHSKRTLWTMRRYAVAVVVEEPLDLAALSAGKCDVDEDSSFCMDRHDTTPWHPLVPPIQLGFAPHEYGQPPVDVALLKPPIPPTLSSGVPELSVERQHEISLAYRKLHTEVARAGLYDCRVRSYVIEGCRYMALGLASAIAYLWGQYNSSTVAFLGSAVSLGMLWHQLTFTAHDLGHLGATHDYHTDSVAGILITDLLGGLSLGWWKDNHNVHHLVTNHPEHDPDIQHLPFFAISTRFLENIKSTYYQCVLPLDGAARFFLQYQHRLYFLVMCFARFNLYALSYGYLLGFRKGRSNRFRSLEVICVTLFWLWYGQLLASIPGKWYGIRLAYLLISHIVTSPLHIQITLSHFGMSTADHGVVECFAARQLRTTMDVDCHPIFDPFHGGLHMQVSHHLFPRLPRHNLRAARTLVKRFAKEQGLQYTEYPFVQGNKLVLDVLRDVAKQVRLLGKVALAVSQGELD